MAEILSPFTDRDAHEARAAGFTFVCSMCTKLHVGKGQRKTAWAKTRCAGKNCWGPIGNKMYPEYEGPLKGMLSRFCWICGTQDVNSVLSPASGLLYDGELLGCCHEHERLIREESFDRRDAGVRKTQKVRIAGHVIDW